MRTELYLSEDLCRTIDQASGYLKMEPSALAEEAIRRYLSALPEADRQGIRDYFPAEPIAFYTGGGIWLAAVYVSRFCYYVVSNYCPEWLTLYDHSGEDQDDFYPCQNMISEKCPEEFTPEEARIHDLLCKELDDAMR